MITAILAKFLKTAVKELILSKVAGLQSVTLLKDECFQLFFKDFANLLGTTV